VLELLIPQDSLRLVNVNLPPEPRGITWTRQAVKHYDGKVVPGRDPMGREHFWFTVVPLEENEPGTDLFAMEHGYVSITPLELDLTHHPALDRAQRETPLDEVDTTDTDRPKGSAAVPESDDMAEVGSTSASS
jgi:5'-nucleotidase